MKAVLIFVAVLAAGGLALYLKEKLALTPTQAKQRDTAISGYGSGTSGVYSQVG